MAISSTVMPSAVVRGAGPSATLRKWAGLVEMTGNGMGCPKASSQPVAKQPQGYQAPGRLWAPQSLLLPIPKLN